MESKTLCIFLFLQVCEQSSYYFTHLDDTPRKRAGGRADFRVRGEAQPYKVGNCILHPGDELALMYHCRELSVTHIKRFILHGDNTGGTGGCPFISIFLSIFSAHQGARSHVR